MKQLWLIVVAVWMSVAWSQGMLGTQESLGAQEASATQQGFLESFDSPSSEFGAYLFVGSGEVWSGQLTNGSYQLSNSSDTSSVNYIYATALTGVTAPLSSNVVGVDIAGQFSDQNYSQAGLLFNFDAQNSYYYALLVKGGNQVSLALRDANGFQELASTTSDALRVGQVNHLSVVPDNGVLRFLVNDVEVMSIESPSLAPGGVGIIATGTGNFVFDNFLVGSLTSNP
jgi:hypothetical protein